MGTGGRGRSSWLQRTDPGQQVIGSSRQTRPPGAEAASRGAGLVEHLTAFDSGPLIDQHLAEAKSGLRLPGGIAPGSRLINGAAVCHCGARILERGLCTRQSGERLGLDRGLPHGLGQRDPSGEVVERGCRVTPAHCQPAQPNPQSRLGEAVVSHGSQLQRLLAKGDRGWELAGLGR
jgi:hypothetical protein